MKAICIYNPISGKGKAKLVIPQIIKLLTNQFEKVEVYEVSTIENLNQFVIEKINEYELAITLGGDGTIHTFFNALMLVEKEVRPKILTLPFGTSNDFTTLIELPKMLEDQIKLINPDNEYELNLTQINDNYFVYAAAHGKFTKVSYTTKREHLRFWGYIAYLFALIPDFFKRYKYQVILDYEGKRMKVNALAIFVLSSYRNGSINLHRLAKTKQKFVTSNLEIVIFRRKWLLSFFKMGFFYLKRGKVSKRDLHIKTDQIKITVPEKSRWNVDGESGPSGSAQFTLIPRAITVYTNFKSKI